MLDSASAAMPQHGRPSARAGRPPHAPSVRQELLSPAADRRGPPWGSRTTYLLWYGPATAINLLLLGRGPTHALLPAEAALLNLVLTVVLRGDRVAWSRLGSRQRSSDN